MVEARRILSKFKVLVQVLPVDDKVIELALHSKFKDFEDAIQYFTTIESGITILLTRNIKDYKKAGIPVQTPALYQRFIYRQWKNKKDCCQQHLKSIKTLFNLTDI